MKIHFAICLVALSGCGAPDSIGLFGLPADSSDSSDATDSADAQAAPPGEPDARPDNETDGGVAPDSEDAGNSTGSGGVSGSGGHTSSGGRTPVASGGAPATACVEGKTRCSSQQTMQLCGATGDWEPPTECQRCPREWVQCCYIDACNCVSSVALCSQ